MRNIVTENNLMKISFDLSKVKTKRQRYKLEKLAKENRFKTLDEYLNSFVGRTKWRLDVPTLKQYGRDKLATKAEKSVISALSELCNPNKTHYPQSNESDFFGVEIECIVPKFEDNEGQLMNSWDCMREMQEMIKTKQIKRTSVKSDGSIRCDESYFAVEFAVLSRLSDYSNLEKLCKLLNELNAKVNSSCGLHVHLDARRLASSKVKEVGRKFAKALPVLMSMLPESRQNNQYCKAGVSKLNGSRYYAINLTAYSKYKTIEVRCHSSTTDFNKIMNWTKLLFAIKNSEIKKVCRDVNELTDFVKIDENLMEYMQQRIDLFDSSKLKASAPTMIIDSDFAA